VLGAEAEEVGGLVGGDEEGRLAEGETDGLNKKKSEVDALSVNTTSRGCFERCCSNKKTPPYHSNLSFVTLRNQRPTLLRAPAYRTPSEASPWRRVKG